MRNFIFKLELEFLFDKHQITNADQDKIRRILLLNNSLMDRGKVFHLREHSQWSGQLENLTSNTNFIKALYQLVTLEDDLHLPIELKHKILANATP